MHSLRQKLIQAANDAGAQAVGFARCGEVNHMHWEKYTRWLGRGAAGGMDYLSNYPELRRNPAVMSEGARTVMVCAFSYYHGETQHPQAARIAMYAHGSDYHEVLRKRLEPVAALLRDAGHTARVCVDSAPVLERYWAVQAGVGFIGRNRMLIVPGKGSYFFLAEILTSAELEPDAPCTLSCAGCGRCVAACPGGALRADGGFDARRCLSYLTIEHRGGMPPKVDGRPVSAVLGRRLYGCDTCQEVCVHNSSPIPTEIDEFRLRPALKNITRADVLEMTQERFSTLFAHSPVKRVKLEGLKRDAAAGLFECPGDGA